MVKVCLSRQIFIVPNGESRTRLSHGDTVTSVDMNPVSDSSVVLWFELRSCRSRQPLWQAKTVGTVVRERNHAYVKETMRTGHADSGKYAWASLHASEHQSTDGVQLYRRTVAIAELLRS